MANTMEIMQLCSASVATGAGDTFKLSGWRMPLGAIPIQIYTTQATAFNGTVKLEGTIATEAEVFAGTERWSDIDGALWTSEIIDAIFAQCTHIRSNITQYTSGAISIRIGF